MEMINEYKKHKEKQLIDKSPGSLYNSWRSKVYTKKGKDIGFPEKWSTFKGFKEDVQEEWISGYILIRRDTNLPYSKENCYWVEKGYENISKLISLEYNGDTKTLIEWCNQFDLNYNGVKGRYYKNKEYSSEEILFGVRSKPKKKINDISELEYQEQRNKASKMVSSYKIKDKKKGFDTDLSIEYMLELMNKPCTYCGDTELIGADRIDNNCGHTKENVVPCCYTCNIARNNNFSFE